jgi:hypothetical protein
MASLTGELQRREAAAHREVNELRGELRGWNSGWRGPGRGCPGWRSPGKRSPGSSAGQARTSRRRLIRCRPARGWPTGRRSGW